jgi:hypothetical protein
MIRVIEDPSQRIGENGQSFIEPDAVLAPVRGHPCAGPIRIPSGFSIPTRGRPVVWEQNEASGERRIVPTNRSQYALACDTDCCGDPKVAEPDTIKVGACPGNCGLVVCTIKARPPLQTTKVTESRPGNAANDH